ncbi:MAG: 2-C-methyl-D-erythritol 4-phosphate cytidylyltransferase [Clostridiales bacterium]|nr:2-C-methyl-D-erythritol 4-phosphate cytidylyltransferase [Roseburia sp.]MDD7638010.1 2-C-methyl-D-erythritol 4-phosphate cytidylyltransferase [Clostridiales bacterium]MDY4113529.1 2-C-methyl-D-erythritol 4-phosphate cytidylyltransferase [Roseburia sp.]
MERITAIILAAGSGKRMNSTVHKQYMVLAGKPMLYYALKAFDESAVTDIVLVTGVDEITYCKREIVDKYNIHKVRTIVEGGRERYHSVYAGLKAAVGSDYVLIHDGARPFVTEDIIARSIETAKACSACVVGMPVKDTIKVVGTDGFAKETPERKKLWQVQTPQSFSYSLIVDAYEKVVALEDDTVTDDAMVLERMTGRQVRVIEGSYRNIKITTPEDLLVAEAYLKDVVKK